MWILLFFSVCVFWGGCFGLGFFVFFKYPPKPFIFRILNHQADGGFPVFNEMFFRERFVNGERNVFIIPLYSLQPPETLVLPNNKLYSFIVLRKFTATRIFFFEVVAGVNYLIRNYNVFQMNSRNVLWLP